MINRNRIMTIAFLSALTTLVALAFAAADPWTARDLLTAEQFAPVVEKGAQPPVYYVGFNVLYRSKHIPRAVYAGPGAELKGLDLLKTALKDVPRDKEIVIYCGCCPIDKCPNLRPAFQTAREMGMIHLGVSTCPQTVSVNIVGVKMSWASVTFIRAMIACLTTSSLSEGTRLS